MSDLKEVIVYTDGGCGNNGGAGVEGFAAVFVHPKGPRVYFDRKVEAERATNNRAELRAVQLALSQGTPEIRKGVHLTVVTDSKWVIGALSENWKIRENLDLVEACRKLQAEFGRVTFQWTRGHVGQPENELANELAQRMAGTWKGGRSRLTPELRELVAQRVQAGSPPTPAPAQPTPAKTRWVNRHHGERFDVYVGRRRNSAFHFGNPFGHQEGTGATLVLGSREEAVQAFADWLAGTAYQEVEPERRQWILDNLPTLQGKVIACSCAPLLCHAGILAQLADQA